VEKVGSPPLLDYSSHISILLLCSDLLDW